MKYKKLGRTGLLVSELCFGTMTFAGEGFWEAIGQLSQEEANNLIAQALDAHSSGPESLSGAVKRRVGNKPLYPIDYKI